MSGETYSEAECMEAAESESFYDLYIATEGLLCLGSVCFRDAVKDGYCEECNPNKSEVPATRKLSPKKKVAKTSPRVVVATPSRERKGKHCAERGCRKMAFSGMTYCYQCAVKHKLITHGHYSMCKEEGCEMQIRKGGYCQRHGKEHGVAPRKQCEADGCTRQAKKQGRCRHHLRELGIDEDYRKCLMEGCDKHGDKGGGYCYTHARQFNVLFPSLAARLSSSSSSRSSSSSGNQVA